MRGSKKCLTILVLLAVAAYLVLYSRLSLLGLSWAKALPLPSILRMFHVGGGTDSLKEGASGAAGDPSPAAAASCPSVLDAMRQGSWHQNITDHQRKEMADVIIRLKNMKEMIALPFYLQRNDSKCGNVTAPGRIDHQSGKRYIERYNRWPATCRPDGPTPCCYHNVCVNRSVEDCACPNCTDMRTLVFAEHATWRPKDEGCSFPRSLTGEELCAVMRGHTLMMVGDSLTMQFYAAFLMLLRGLPYGVFHKGVRHTERQRCRGTDFFQLHSCIPHIDHDASLCNGTARAKYLDYYHPSPGATSPQTMIRSVTDVLSRNGSILLLGVGSHYQIHKNDSYTVDPQWALRDSVLPLLKQLTAKGIPIRSRLLWMSMNAKMIYKEPEVKREFREMVTKFNEEAERVMREWQVPVFDTYNMTADRVMSLDYAHHGLGLQSIKVQFLFQYLLELQRQGLW